MPNPVYSFHNHRFSLDAGELALHQNLMNCIIMGWDWPVTVSNDHDWLTAQPTFAPLSPEWRALKPFFRMQRILREGQAPCSA